MVMGLILSALACFGFVLVEAHTSYITYIINTPVVVDRRKYTLIATRSQTQQLLTALFLHRIREQTAHRLAVVNAANRFGDQGRNREYRHIRQAFLWRDGNGVGGHNLHNIALCAQAFDGSAGE